jgi:hypothetical protein
VAKPQPGATDSTGLQVERVHTSLCVNSRPAEPLGRGQVQWGVDIDCREAQGPFLGSGNVLYLVLGAPYNVQITTKTLET